MDPATTFTQLVPVAPIDRVAVPAPRASLPAGVIIRGMDELARFAQMVEKSGMAPKGMTAAGIGVAVQFGLELGLAPMQSLQSVAVINNCPGIYGDAAKALVESSGLLEDFDEWYEVAGQRVDALPAKLTDDCRAACSSKRVGRRGQTQYFSVADAKLAGLWGKAGPWTQYPARMLRFRARGFNLRDNFADVLRGLKTVEELRDYPDTTGPARRQEPVAAPVSATAPDNQEAVAPTLDSYQQQDTTTLWPAGDAYEGPHARKP